jgi:hypothetical protein
MKLRRCSEIVQDVKALKMKDKFLKVTFEYISILNENI